MGGFSVPRIFRVEVLDEDAVIITFEDGTCASYSAFLLHAMVDQAQRIAVEPDYAMREHF